MKNSIRTVVLLIVVSAVLCLSGCGKPSRYEQAAAALANGDYAASAEAFEALGEYKDSQAQAAEARLLAAKQSDYEKAVLLAGSGSYDEAAELFLSLGDYLDSAQLALSAEYSAAAALAEAARWESAAERFEKLGNYRDSSEQAAECRREAMEANYTEAVKLFDLGDYAQAESLFLLAPEHDDAGLYLKAIALSSCEVGDTVSFGNYTQDADGAASSPIDWVVLSNEDGRLLLLSEQGLDSMRFHQSLYPFWADSEMRQWLNHSFFPAAFSEDEQRLIESSLITTPGYMSNLGLYMGGPDAEDRVFLLSKEELSEYLPEESGRTCQPSPYALSAGATADEGGSCAWWTRSPGNHHGKICIVDADGDLNPDGQVSRSYVCVRPAIWVDIHNLSLTDIVE